MAGSRKEGVTRRTVARFGAIAAALAASEDFAAADGGRAAQAEIDVTDPPFGAIGNGQADDSVAIIAAVAALPSGGGVVRLPGGRTYRFDRTVDDGGKAVLFAIGHADVIGPTQGPIFDLRTNGSNIRGAGRGATVLRLSPPARMASPPSYSASLRQGRLVAMRMVQPGTGLFSTPLMDVEESPDGNGAAIIVSIGTQAVVRSDIVASGTGYGSAPPTRMLGGGECAVRIDDANHCSLSDFTVDLDAIPHAVGIFQRGGWYADLERIEIRADRQHPTAIALVVDSHTLGRPGRNGSYGGAYVSRYAQIVAKRVFVVGHDRSSATTLHFDTLDGANLHFHGAVAVTLTNAVLQDAEGAFLDLVNVDGLMMTGGDVEGSATLIRARGSCNNVRLFPVAYSATGPAIQGPIGSGWRLDLAKSNASIEMLQTGSAGSAGTAFRNVGWAEQHRVGLPYSGDSLVSCSNVRMTGPRSGILDNPKNPCFALILTISGQLILRYGPAGTREATLTDIATFDSAGLSMPGLHAGRPAPGSKRLWYDPSDGFRVKFQP